MRLRWCFASVLAGCFSDAPVIGGSDDSEGSTSTPTTTTSMTTSTSTTTSTSAPGTSGEPQTSSESGEITGGVTTSEQTSTDSSSSGGTQRCVSTDFDGEMITCVEGELALPLGLSQVTFTSASGAVMNPCVEHAADGDGWTSPLEGGYVFVEIHPNDPATLSFDLPVASVTFEVGPHHEEDLTANISLCGTTAGSCENPEVTGDQSTFGTMMKDMAGATTLSLFMTKATGYIAIDNLQVCFD